MSGVRVAAVDLGASSGRIVIGCRTERGFSLREVHRFPNQPRPVGGVLRWDARALFAGICDVLRAAAADGPVDAVSVDGWAVDYGLLDEDGGLVADPASYRDPRTGPPFAAVTGTGGGVNGVDAARLYQATGIAAQPITALSPVIGRIYDWVLALLPHRRGTAVEVETGPAAADQISLPMPSKPKR